MNRRRLDAEGLRDAMLAVSGELNPKAGGPGVLVPIEKEVEDLIFTEAEVVDLWPETPDPAEHLRRSLYLFRKRNVRYPMFDAFDAPDTQTACPQRAVSTHALQALVLAQQRLRRRSRPRPSPAGSSARRGRSDARVDRAYRIVLGREPRAEGDRRRPARSSHRRPRCCATAAERGAGRSPGRTFRPRTDPAEAAAWVDFALAMLNRNEFVYVP